MYDITPPELIQYHHSMLQDKVRTQTFLRAILQEVQPGDVVLDMGCGTGILAYFACLAGAAHVYAIEQGPIIEVAKTLSLHNGFADKITFIQDWSTLIELPEAVDIIITETIGNNGFEEGILGFVQDAKKRFLKENGRIIPQSLTMHLVPLESPQSYAFFEEWADNQFSYAYTSAHDYAINNLWWIHLDVDTFLAASQTVNTIHLKQTETSEYSGSLSFYATQDGLLQGFGAYFSAELAPGIALTNKPPTQTPSWAHTFFPLERPLPVKQNDVIQFHIQTKNNASHWEWTTIVGDSTLKHNTEMGRLQAPQSAIAPSFKPRQNLNGNIDHFILALMTGEHTVAEITQAVKEKFGNSFANELEIITSVNEMVDLYGR